ncbi:coiled-coil domain-containing protein 78 isoform X3 [Dasypus novemcinctus]|uniref:coiled-coil domain-containing protein 78 isoform X3 n=1 Tax=Dasypus novemcinctus TaxID=9361 RepID=UPI0026603C5D|nr:coiled-coil domain-containing protein 78 isoform X3 [Dasypus novemcinctus]
MQHREARGPGPGAPPQADGNQAEDWLLGVPGDTPVWATSLEMELHSNLVLSEEQRLQTSRELVDLQMATHRLQAQHEAELFTLRSEVLRLESRVLELELQGRPGQSRGREAPGKPLGGQERRPGDSEPTLGQQRALEAHVAALGRQLQGAREEARLAGQRLATHTVALAACQGQLCHAEAENSRLQLQLKRLNEEYTARLQRCARDVAHYADSAGRAPDAGPLRAFLEATLEDIRVAHRSRETQLARAARTYRKRLADLSRRHEELLATHRLRDPQGHLQCSHRRPPVAAAARGHGSQPPAEEQGEAGGGAPEAPCPADQGSLQRGKPGGLGVLPFPTEATQGETAEPQGLDAVSWAQIHRKLQDFSHGTQAELERERAQLLARATVAEEQLAELQEYVDQHLLRYKQEILRLRKLLGTAAPRRARPASPRDPRARSR